MKLFIVSSVFVIAFFGCHILSAQTYVMGLNDFIDYNNVNMTNSRSSNTYNDVKGSPFAYGPFVVGQVKLNNGKYYDGELRYDNYKQNLEFKNEKGEVFEVLTPENINSVSINEVKLVYRGMDGSGGFYRQLLPGTYNLLAQDLVEYQDPKPARPYVEASPARFIKKNPEYFLWNDKTGLKELKNKKSLDGLIAEHSKEIDTFVKKGKVKFTNEDDLIKLVTFLNSLE